jgi:hypothetical protein
MMQKKGFGRFNNGYEGLIRAARTYIRSSFFHQVVKILSGNLRDNHLMTEVMSFWIQTELKPTSG